MYISRKELQRGLYRSLLRMLPYEKRILADYFRRHKRHPNLQHPELHSERMIHRVLNETGPLFTELSSKRDMKRLAAKKIQEDRLSVALARTLWFGDADDVYGAVRNAAEESRPWVLKPNNLGGGIIMLADSRWSERTLISKTKQLLEESRKVEAAYKRHAPVAWRNSRAGFLLEERIGDGDGMPNDYKVHVFNGSPRFVSVYTNRGSSLAVQHFDINGEYIFGRNDNGLDLRSPVIVDREFLSAAAALSLELPYTRVDFYIENDILWFGEISPYGSLDGLPGQRDLDKQMGSLWTT